MIRVTVLSSQDNQEIIDHAFKDMNIDYVIQPYQQEKCYDIYFIEIQNQNDLQIIDTLHKTNETLLYMIGPKEFDLVNICIRLQTHLYFIKEELKRDLQKYQDDMYKHIQERFLCYEYKRRGMTMQLRLSQISYVESMRHSIVIHSINGQFVERRNLQDFLKNVSSQFVQIHKSYVVNQQWIKDASSQEVILNDDSILPVGRAFKNTF